jgi:hypothetical protein
MTTRIALCCCGSLRAEASNEPALVGACHCIECQRRTGSPFGVGSYFPKEQVRTEGPSKVYVRGIDSGRKAESHFCPAELLPPFGNGGLGAVPLAHLGHLGLDPVAACLPPYDQPHPSRGRVCRESPVGQIADFTISGKRAAATRRCSASRGLAAGCAGDGAAFADHRPPREVTSTMMGYRKERPRSVASQKSDPWAWVK